MRKYWHVIGIGIQNNLTYRVNYLTRFTDRAIRDKNGIGSWKRPDP